MQVSRPISLNEICVRLSIPTIFDFRHACRCNECRKCCKKSRKEKNDCFDEYCRGFPDDFIDLTEAA